jgi:serine/threonine-protein kinase HipA
MLIHLVGETIDAASAHHKAGEGELIPVFRGVYLDAQGDADAMLREYAVRIAHYIYPAAYLCSASAVNLGPTGDGRLFMSGRRNQRTRLRGLEIVQTQAPVRPSIDKAIIGDRMGEFTMNVSSPEQRLLEAFRMRSEQANALTEDMRRVTADRLIAEYGSTDAVADALWTLARSNDWFREGEGAERYLRVSARRTITTANRAAFHLDVAWHGKSMGKLSHDGHEWRWSAAKGPNPPLIRETLPGTLPPFIESLMPEGWLAQVLNEQDQRALLRHGKRYMSNVTVGVDRAELASLPTDILHGRLRQFSENGVFVGDYRGPDRGTFDESFEANLARIFAAGTTPRLSGVQIKAPMFLDNDGGLIPATNLPFTHILKPAGTSGFEQMPVVEWLCLELARLTGFSTPQIALIRMPSEMPPALLVERFDIREDDTDMRRMALEDFCSILGVPAEDKYKGTIERMARSLRSLSTRPPEDIATLFARALFAWLIADGDMHLKNVAMLKTALPGARDFDSVRMAPLYDALTTRVFPGMQDDHMALKLAGKDDRLDFKDFETLARTIELPLSSARALVSELTTTLEVALRQVKLPELVVENRAAASVATTVMQIVGTRCAAMKASL